MTTLIPSLANQGFTKILKAQRLLEDAEDLYKKAIDERELSLIRPIEQWKGCEAEEDPVKIILENIRTAINALTDCESYGLQIGLYEEDDYENIELNNHVNPVHQEIINNLLDNKPFI